MSLVVAVKGTEGIVLAADSRVTLTSQAGFPSTFDNATKLLSLGEPHNWVGAVTCGIATIGGRTHHSLIPEFEPTLGEKRLSVHEYAVRLSAFFQDRWQASGQSNDIGNAEFYVGGYDENKPYGAVYYFATPTYPTPIEHNAGKFGISWGGQRNIVDRIIHGYDPQLLPALQQFFSLPDEQVEAFRMRLASQIEYRTPYDVLALQDCVDLAAFLIRATITAQSVSTDLRGVGGPIDVATITRTDGFRWVQRKRVQGE